MNRLPTLLPLFLVLFCFSCNSSATNSENATDTAAAEKIIQETKIIDSLTVELDQETQKLDEVMDELSQEFNQ